MRFPPKAVSICSEKEIVFDYRKNHKYNKSANLCLNTIN